MEEAEVRRIVGLAFETPEEAREALAAAHRMQEQDLLRVHDAAIITRRADGGAEVEPPTSFIGTLVTGSRAGGELQDLSKPGQAVLALLVSNLAGMAVIEELRRFRSTRVVYTKLPTAA